MDMGTGTARTIVAAPSGGKISRQTSSGSNSTLAVWTQNTTGTGATISADMDARYNAGFTKAGSGLLTLTGAVENLSAFNLSDGSVSFPVGSSFNNPFATLVFPWITLERQVIIEGTLTRLAREESMAYFHSRPRASQLAAWVSRQSSVVPDRAALESGMKAVEQKHAGAEVPMPPFWGGYLVTPASVEFWQGRRSRLHDRLRYRREQAGGPWIIERLSP
jgi:hypothetical protein